MIKICRILLTWLPHCPTRSASSRCHQKSTNSYMVVHVTQTNNIMKPHIIIHTISLGVACQKQHNTRWQDVYVRYERSTQTGRYVLHLSSVFLIGTRCYQMRTNHYMSYTTNKIRGLHITFCNKYVGHGGCWLPGVQYVFDDIEGPDTATYSILPGIFQRHHSTTGRQDVYVRYKWLIQTGRYVLHLLSVFLIGTRCYQMWTNRCTSHATNKIGGPHLAFCNKYIRFVWRGGCWLPGACGQWHREAAYCNLRHTSWYIPEAP